MSNDFYGLWLDNFGFIGVQDDPSTPGNPSYNKWISVPSGGYKTVASNNTNGGIFPIFYRTGTTSPANMYVPFPGTNFNGSFNVGFSATSNGSLTSPPCPIIFRPRLLESADSIALDSIIFPANNANAQWLNRMSLYNNILLDSIDVSNDSLLNAFMIQTAASNMGKLISLNSTVTNPDKYNTTDMTAAQQLCNSISANCGIETNMKLINHIIIGNYLADAPLSASQISDLRILANKCPFTDGIAVYQARVLLSEVDSLTAVYLNECEMVIDERRYDVNNNMEPKQNLFFRVYPNPATNQLTIGYELKENEKGLFEIYNIMGARILSVNLSANKTIETLNISPLNAGIYFYKIVVNDQLIESNKLIITK